MDKQETTQTRSTKMDKAAKAKLERDILDSCKGVPVFASEFARKHDVEEHAVKLAIRRLSRRGLIYMATRPLVDYWGSTEAGWRTVCEVEGCCRVGGHAGQHDIQDRS